MNNNKILTELPKKKNNIDWNKTIDMKIDIMYNNLIYTVLVVNYITKEKRIYVQFENKIFNFNRNQFKQAGIGKLTGEYVIDYRYEINTTIKQKRSHLKLIERFRNPEKIYKYECENCKNIDIISEIHILAGKGCNVCCRATKKVIRGFNDIATTHPNTLLFLKDKEEGFKYSQGSTKKVEIICPNCKFEKKIAINRLIRNKISCERCSDGISYPNKFIFNFLKQTKLDFYREQTFNWSKRKRYDFYIPELNIIIEAHGKQHYEKTGRYFGQVSTNDVYKELLAIYNQIEHYIVLDCSFSNLKYIKNSIERSSLSEFIDLRTIDWEKCHNYSTDSLIMEIRHLWDKKYSRNKICDFLNISKITLIKYLKIINEFENGFYDPSLEKIKNNEKRSVKVISLIDQKKFKSISDCAKFYGISRSTVKRNNKKFLKIY